MPDIKAVLNDEIRRLARKEIRLATAPLMEVLKEQKIIISALKKRIDQLEKNPLPNAPLMLLLKLWIVPQSRVTKNSVSMPPVSFA